MTELNRLETIWVRRSRSSSPRGDIDEAREGNLGLEVDVVAKIAERIEERVIFPAMSEELAGTGKCSDEA